MLMAGRCFVTAVVHPYSQMMKTAKQTDSGAPFVVKGAERYIMEEQTNDKKRADAMLLLKS